jgi:hypothetical protein
MQRLLLSTLTVLALSPLAHAGIMIEPYLGYEITRNSATVNAAYLSSPVDVDKGGNTTGVNYGLRLGYKLPVMFWFALDADMGSGNQKYDNSLLFPDDSYTRTVMGITAGVDLPILLRAWVGYGFSDQLTLKHGSTSDTLKGTNTKVGLGFKMIPFMSVNLEYIMRTYTDASGDTYTSPTTFSTVYSKATQSTALVSISVPF